MSLALIAEVLAGETMITPGGAVDAVTAQGHEPFLWERWVHDVEVEVAVEVTARAVAAGAVKVEAQALGE